MDDRVQRYIELWELDTYSPELVVFYALRDTFHDLECPPLAKCRPVCLSHTSCRFFRTLGFDPNDEELREVFRFAYALLHGEVTG